MFDRHQRLVPRQLDDYWFDEQVWDREAFNEGDVEIPHRHWHMWVHFLSLGVDDKGIRLRLGQLGEEHEDDLREIDEVCKLEKGGVWCLEGAATRGRAKILLADGLLRAQNRDLPIWRTTSSAFR